MKNDIESVEVKKITNGYILCIKYDDEFDNWVETYCKDMTEVTAKLVEVYGS